MEERRSAIIHARQSERERKEASRVGFLKTRAEKEREKRMSNPLSHSYTNKSEIIHSAIPVMRNRELLNELIKIKNLKIPKFKKIEEFKEFKNYLLNIKIKIFGQI